MYEARMLADGTYVVLDVAVGRTWQPGERAQHMLRSAPMPDLHVCAMAKYSPHLGKWVNRAT